MNLRIKCDGKCRKVTSLPKTIEELKTKIAELFEKSTAKLNINYKDCDGELVSIIDTEDLKNCVAEAEAYKMTCITLLLKDGNSSSRSMSSKKNTTSESSKDKTSSSSEDEENHGFQTVGETKSIQAKAAEEAELLKKKLIEEHQKALAQLDAETKNKISELEQKKDRRRKRSHSGEKKEQRNPFNLMHKIKSINQFCASENIENPLFTLKKIFKSINEEFPALSCNPQLLNLVIKDSEAAVMAALKATCTKVISANPEIAKLGELNRPKFGEMNKEFGKSHCHKHREAKERTEGADRDLRRAEKIAERERRDQEKMAERLRKDAEKAERKAQKLEEKQAKPHHKKDREGHDSEKEAVRATVKALKEQFPNHQKDHIKAIVKQNPTLSPQELAPLIKAAKIAKSSFK